MRFIFTIFFSMLLSFQLQAKKTERPNIIFILTDQWRASSLSYTGNDIVRTPQLDRFASSALNFKNTVSVLPVCTPYRASLMTGRYPTSTGMFINDLYLPSEELCMAEIFKNAGYQTAYLGKWHLDGHGRLNNVIPERRQGFDFWKGLECSHDYNKMPYYENDDQEMKHWKGYSPFAISREAQNYLTEHSNNESPFLLFVSIATPHFPHHTAPNEYMELYKPDKLKLPPNVSEDKRESVLKELQGYYAHCTATDKAIGEIIDKAKELGIFDKSIIVFTSDHGEMMGAHDFNPWMKHTAYSESSNIPFLISYPGIENNAGKIAEAAITTPDILPTLLSLSNIDIPNTIEGYDLSHIVKSPDKDSHRAALYMNPVPFGSMYKIDEYRAVRTNKYTYVKTPQGASMLFDNEKDPYQLDNLINQPKYADIQKKLDKQLMNELHHIGEKKIKDREYYLKEFGYYGQKEFRPDYHIADYNNVEVVISPKKLIRIR